jgi:hypothetical protein
MGILKFSRRLPYCLIVEREMLGSLANSNKFGNVEERISPFLKSPRELIVSPLEGEQKAMQL